MRFEEVLPALREGKKVRRKVWGWLQFIRFEPNDLFKLVDEEGHHVALSIDLFEIDWEVVTERKKIKLRDISSEKLVKNISKRLCTRFSCEDCPLSFVKKSKNVSCNEWARCKDLYSDKFLDQEIEVEE